MTDQTQTTNLPHRNTLPPITFPEELPVCTRIDDIVQAIQSHQVIIICGETGSGKTTQLPKICAHIGRGSKGLIGHTQPRRIAASSTAKRIAQELGTPLGTNVGFKVRFTDTTTNGICIKLMTDGILLAETQTDQLLTQYDTIIIDEAHERSLNIDFLLGYLKQLLPKRPDLKLIITSATIDADKFAQYFKSATSPAPIIEVSGRLYPVEVRYRPVQADKANKDRDITDAIVDAVDELHHIGSGDILIFLPGEREIRDTTLALRKHHPAHTEILPLFARLSATEQERIFKPSNARRIVLATNVAETSLTVPGIRFVIDTGLARVKRYSYRNKVEQLQIEDIAQSAANQRAGRCGRVQSGVCIRLFEEKDFLLRAAFTDPEILRSSLAAVILRMKSLHLTEIESFEFIDPPPQRAIVDGYQLLQELGAVNEQKKLTPLGKQLSKLPLDPRIGRMILAARDNACLHEVLIITSALSVQDPRDRPIEVQTLADAAHQQFNHPKSEFLSYLKIWDWFNDAVTHKKSQRQLQENCRAHFLSHLRLREWREVHTQLVTIVKEHHWQINQEPATIEQIHLAILTGLLGNIGVKSETDAHYLGARGIKFYLWPGSSLAKKAGRWVMAGELVESSKLYARCIAQIAPEWIEKVGAHLLKKSYSDPHWEKRSGHVAAFERATLYGLVVYNQRRIHYGPLDPTLSREIFIRDALVTGEFITNAPFLSHNLKLIQEIEKLEHRSRRTDILVDDTLIEAFYDQQLPAHICNAITFNYWYKKESTHNPKLLCLNRDDLMRHQAAGITTELFPKIMSVAGIDMALDYHFEPGSVRDGVTITVPIYALNQLHADHCDWLVPGMLKEKIHLLVKSLPQKIRRYCVPIPSYASDFCERTPFGQGNLIDAIIKDLRTSYNIVVLRTDFKEEVLPTHHLMNIKVVDTHERQLEMGRNLASLQSKLGEQARQLFQQVIEQNIAPSHSNANQHANKDNIISSENIALDTSKSITDWDFGALPELLEIKRGQELLIGFPALVDKNTHCVLEVFDDPNMAKRTHHKGLLRLFRLQLKEQLKYLEKNIPNIQTMGMQFMSIGLEAELRDQLICTAIERAFLETPLPSDAPTFTQRKELGKTRLGLLANEIARLISQILTQYHITLKKLSSVKAHAAAFKDIQEQLQQLIHKRFIVENNYEQLAHFPRYLNAIAVRIDKLRNDPSRDQQYMAQWASVATPWQRALKDRRDEPAMHQFRWLLEELRVSLYAQELRTPMPISVKRLQKVWDSMQK